MVTRNALLSFVDETLNCSLFKDYAPNGLHVEGKAEIKRLVTGVTASQALIDEAIRLKADALMVHHGYFWRNEKPTIVGMKKHRIASLLAHDINLLAYHLPLDCHETLGNNAQLADVLGIDVQLKEKVDGIPALLWVGELAASLTPDDFTYFLENKLKRKPLHLPATHQPKIKKIAWCTGAADRYLALAASEYVVDAYISGEVSEASSHIARELNVHYFACGHHATERYGIKALGEYIATQFDLTHQFVDIDNPV